MLKKGDIWLFASVLIIMAVIVVPRFMPKDELSTTGRLYAEISVDGEHYQTVELTEDAQDITINTKYGVNILKLHDHGVEMIDADCPDKLCLTFGHVKKIGQSIVCLPHRVLVELVGDPGEGDGVDAVAI